MKQITYNDVIKVRKKLHFKKCICFKRDQAVQGIIYYDDSSGDMYILSDNKILNGENPTFDTGFKYSWNINSYDFPRTILLEGRETYSLAKGISHKPRYKNPFTALNKLKKKLDFCGSGVKNALEDIKKKYPKISLEKITWNQATLFFNDSMWEESFNRLKDANIKLIFPKPAKKKIAAKKKRSKK